MTRVVQRPEGQCLLIPPQKLDSEGTGRRHWIACLFTSRRPGGGDPDTILANTKLAVADMNRQIQQIYSEQIIEGEEIGYPGHLWSCRINSGHFRVPWKSTKGVLKESGLGMFVVRRASDPA